MNHVEGYIGASEKEVAAVQGKCGTGAWFCIRGIQLVWCMVR
jgi:hypothetical protein